VLLTKVFSRLTVAPVVVRICNPQMALVFTTIVVRVADKARLPVVVEVGVADRNKVCSMGEINEAIVIVLVMGTIGGQVKVIKPNVSRRLNADCITIRGDHLRKLKVANDNILLPFDHVANVDESFSAS
jgi:hypothetical protein